MSFLHLRMRNSNKSTFDGNRGRFHSTVNNTSLLGMLLMLPLLIINAEAVNTTALGNELATLGASNDATNARVFRQDFCTPYRGMMNKSDFIDIPSALSGSELSVVTFPSKYFIYDYETGIDPVYPGIHARMLDYIAEKGNFTWRNSFGVFERGGINNKELLNQKTKNYDVFVGVFSPSPERMSLGVSFVDGHADGSILMIRDVPPPEDKINWFNWTNPFTPNVWFALIGIVVMSAFVYQLIETIGKGPEDDERSARVWLKDNLYLTFINFTGNYSYEPSTLGARVFGIVFAFWAMLITAAYTANLASLLVGREVYGLQINSIQDAVAQNFKICVDEGTFAEDILIQEHPETIPLLVPLPNEQLYDSLNRGDCQILIEYMSDWKTTKFQVKENPKCTLKWEGRKIKSIKDGFATRMDPGILCTDLVNQVLSYYVRYMESQGVLKELWDEHVDYYSVDGHCDEEPDPLLDASETSETPDGSARRFLETIGDARGTRRFLSEDSSEDGDSAALTLEDMAGTFALQIVGSVFAIFVSTLSWYERKMRKKRTERKRKKSVAEGNASHGSVYTGENGEEEGRVDTNASTRGASVDQQLRELNDRTELLDKKLEALSDMMRQLLEDKKPTHPYR